MNVIDPSNGISFADGKVAGWPIMGVSPIVNCAFVIGTAGPPIGPNEYSRSGLRFRE
ncbi:hypothetical protein D3C85_1922190 [compost metagenome]